MPLLKSERILCALVANLGEIAKSAGYENDLVVERAKPEGNVAADSKVLLTAGVMSRDDNAPLGWESWNWPMQALAWAMAPVDTQSIEDRLTSMGMDIYRRIAADRHLGGSDGLAVYIEFDEQRPGIDEAARCVSVRFTVQWRHVRGDPYSD